MMRQLFIKYLNDKFKARSPQSSGTPPPKVKLKKIPVISSPRSSSKLNLYSYEHATRQQASLRAGRRSSRSINHTAQTLKKQNQKVVKSWNSWRPVKSIWNHLARNSSPVLGLKVQNLAMTKIGRHPSKKFVRPEINACQKILLPFRKNRSQARQQQQPSCTTNPATKATIASKRAVNQPVQTVLIVEMQTAVALNASAVRALQQQTRSFSERLLWKVIAVGQLLPIEARMAMTKTVIAQMRRSIAISTRDLSNWAETRWSAFYHWISLGKGSSDPATKSYIYPLSLYQSQSYFLQQLSLESEPGKPATHPCYLQCFRHQFFWSYLANSTKAMIEPSSLMSESQEAQTLYLSWSFQKRASAASLTI